jgi:hypothetical protein
MMRKYEKGELHLDRSPLEARPGGGTHGLNKRLTGLTLEQTRQRLSDLDRSQLPSVEQAQEMQAERQDRGRVCLGEQSLKNIARPLRVYRIGPRPAIEQRTTSPTALPFPDKPSIAVLPFANMSGDPEQEYFADGMVDPLFWDVPEPDLRSRRGSEGQK